MFLSVCISQTRSDLSLTTWLLFPASITYTSIIYTISIHMSVLNNLCSITETHCSVDKWTHFFYKLSKHLANILVI